MFLKNIKIKNRMRPSIGLGLEAWKPCSLRPIILLETNLCIVSLSEHRCLKDSACLHTTLRHYLCGLQCSLSSLVDVTVISSAQVYSGCIQLHVNVDCPLGSAKDVVPSWQTAIIASLDIYMANRAAHARHWHGKARHDEAWHAALSCRAA